MNICLKCWRTKDEYQADRIGPAGFWNAVLVYDRVNRHEPGVGRGISVSKVGVSVNAQMIFFLKPFARQWFIWHHALMALVGVVG